MSDDAKKNDRVTLPVLFRGLLECRWSRAEGVVIGPAFVRVRVLGVIVFPEAVEPPLVDGYLTTKQDDMWALAPGLVGGVRPGQQVTVEVHVGKPFTAQLVVELLDEPTQATFMPRDLPADGVTQGDYQGQIDDALDALDESLGAHNAALIEKLVVNSIAQLEARRSQPGDVHFSSSQPPSPDATIVLVGVVRGGGNGEPAERAARVLCGVSGGVVRMCYEREAAEEQARLHGGDLFALKVAALQ